MSHEEQQYAIRFSFRARLEIDEALIRLAELTDEDYAIDWFNGFLNVLAALSNNPNRYPIASESRFFRDTVHVFLYRLTVRRVGYHVFYTIVETVEDAPYVHILHVRHASRRPMTRAEARKIE